MAGKYIRGSVTSNSGHIHSYYVDKNGDGWTSTECHPDSKSICHRHRIIKYHIQEAKSACHPYCLDRFGYEGVSMHGHNIVSKTTSPHKNVVKRKSIQEIRAAKKGKRTSSRKRLNKSNVKRNSMTQKTTNRKVNKSVNKRSVTNVHTQRKVTTSSNVLGGVAYARGNMKGNQPNPNRRTTRTRKTGGY